MIIIIINELFKQVQFYNYSIPYTKEQCTYYASYEVFN
jgi:hypothetical protein